MEGLAFEEVEDALLLPCKNPKRRDLEGHLVVFSVSLSSMKLDPKPRVFLPLKELDSTGLGEELSPLRHRSPPRNPVPDSGGGPGGSDGGDGPGREDPRHKGAQKEEPSSAGRAGVSSGRQPRPGRRRSRGKGNADPVRKGTGEVEKRP